MKQDLQQSSEIIDNLKQIVTSRNATDKDIKIDGLNREILDLHSRLNLMNISMRALATQKEELIKSIDIILIKNLLQISILDWFTIFK